MSVKVITAIWDEKHLAGSDLLVALALADWADDNGRCYPSIASVASKSRLSRSQAQRVLRRLEEAGHLVVESNASGGAPGTTKRYRLNMKRLTGSARATPIPKTGSTGATPTGSTDATGSVDATGSTHAADGSHGCAETGSTGATLTVIEPSITVNVVGQADETQQFREFDANAKADDTDPNLLQVDAEPATQSFDKLPPCPAQKIIDLYNAKLPELPCAKILSEKRRSAIRYRWRWVLTNKREDGSRRAASADEALRWFEGFFNRARQNDFVMGRTPRGAGHENWRADLDYLMSERGLIQVIEKTGNPA